MWPQESGNQGYCKQAVRAWGETPATANGSGEATRPTSFYSRWALLRPSINSENTRYLQAWLKAYWEREQKKCVTLVRQTKVPSWKPRGNHYFFPNLGYHGRRTWIIFLRTLAYLEGRTHAGLLNTRGSEANTSTQEIYQKQSGTTHHMRGTWTSTCLFRYKGKLGDQSMLQKQNLERIDAHKYKIQVGEIDTLLFIVGVFCSMCMLCPSSWG